MTAERFEILRKSFQKGLTVDLKTFQLYYKKSGKKLKYIRYDNKEYVIINKQIWWVPMVIGAFLGFDVIGTTWFPKDDNPFNYHPGNYLFLTKEESKIYLEERRKSKFDWKDVDALTEITIPARGNYLKPLAFLFGVSLKEIRNLKYQNSLKIFGLRYAELKRYNRIA